MTLARLGSATLGLARAGVPTPAYDRPVVGVGIVHLGVGGFHRAHQAVYVDELLGRGLGDGWGICGVGLLPGDAAMRDALHGQECLYTLVVKNADGSARPRVVGSIVDYHYAPDDPEAVLAVMSAAATRIVSLTITEGGYRLDAAARADAASSRMPTTAFGYLVEALRRRWAAGTPPFTVMSCDNLAGNGRAAREAVVGFADLVDPDLADWIMASVAFPSSMVDRITPVTVEADRHLAAQEVGLDDAWPAVCEDFRQWVLEDDFPAGRPPLEEVDVQLVDDVEPYELMKLRLLNAGHQALAYTGHLLGHRLVHEAAADPDLSRFVRGYMTDEGAPTLPPVPGIDLDDYQRVLMQRFANPAVEDTVARLCADSSNRIPTWLVPVIRANLAAGGEIRRSAFVVAAWARYAEGVDEQGVAIDVVDADRDGIMAAARSRDPLDFLRQERHFGDLATDERFATAFLEARASIASEGTREALTAWS